MIKSSNSVGKPNVISNGITENPNGESENPITGSKYHLHFINWHFGNQANTFKIFYLLTPSPPFLQLRNLQDIMRMFITPIMQFRSLFVIVKISGQEYF